jgi:hypothetical protein
VNQQPPAQLHLLEACYDSVVGEGVNVEFHLLHKGLAM